MPRKECKVSRQRSRGNAITINGLLTWRAKRLRSLRLDGNQSEHQADIAAIDHVLVNVLSFAGDIEALREANGTLTTRQITERGGLTMRPGYQLSG